MTSDKKIINLKTLAEKAKPYDPSTYRTKYFVEIVNENPKLQEQFKEVITEEFLKRIEEVGECYFVINNRSYKSKKKLRKQVRVSLCGPERAPLISVDI